LARKEPVAAQEDWAEKRWDFGGGGAFFPEEEDKREKGKGKKKGWEGVRGEGDCGGVYATRGGGGFVNESKS